jgi:hypothetical protein
MKLVRWELKIGFFKGLLLGMRHYYFKSKDEEVFEEDVVIYIGVIQIVITLIRVKE